MNSRDALGALLLLGGLAAALLLAPDRPGPGPLALCTAVAAFHAALLMPAVGPGKAIYAFLPFVLALPAIASSSSGHGWAFKNSCVRSSFNKSESSSTQTSFFNAIYSATFVTNVFEQNFK